MTTVAPQTAAFKALIADVFGATSTAPDAAPLTDRQIYRETVASVAARAAGHRDGGRAYGARRARER